VGKRPAVARVIGRRLLAAIPVIFLVSVLTFSLTLLIPGDAATLIAGDNQDPELIASLREQLGLDRPVIVQYADWVSGLVRGDLGESYYSKRPVSTEIANRVPVTFGLAMLAVTFAAVLALPSGIFAALRRGTMWDRSVTVGSSLGVALPNYWFGMLLIVVFALNLHWFPAIGYVPFTEDPAEWLRHMFLPAVTLALAGWAEITRQTRSAMLHELDQDYVRTATAKGLRRRSVVFKHTAKNAAIPVVTVIGLQASYLFGGTVIIERIFGIPGLGQLAISAVYSRDIPVIQGVVLVSTVVVITVNLAIDILYPVLNPKVRTA
jgi:peptide/nickel transport system permease protein